MKNNSKIGLTLSLLALFQISLAYMEIPLRKGPLNMNTPHAVNLQTTVTTEQEYFEGLLTPNTDQDYYYE